MTATSQQLLDAYQFVFQALVRHWRKGVIVFACAAPLALVGTLLMPRTYQSEARLFVRFGRENQVDPTAAGSPMVALYESRENEINSLTEILKSRSLLDRVVSELGPDYIQHGGQPQAEAPTSVPSQTHQRAVTRLGRQVSIFAPRKSNIITLSCRANSPAVAQQIVAKLVEVYQEEHVRVHRSPASYQFFEEQARQSLTAWQQAAEEMRQRKDRLGVVTIEGGRKKLEDQIADVDRRVLADLAELEAAHAKMESLELLIVALPAKLITQQTAAPSASFDGMRQTLFSLEAQEQELLAKMQTGHPRLVALQAQVAQAREILANQPTERFQTTEAINPSRQSLEQLLLNEQARAAELAAGAAALQDQQEELQDQLRELNSEAIAIDELQQRVAMAEANHKEYSQRLEQTRINRTLDDERISSLTVVQPATFVAAPSGPRRSVVLALGIFVAALSSVGAALAAAWLNPVMTTVEQLATVFDMPLTGVIPRGAVRVAVGA